MRKIRFKQPSDALKKMSTPIQDGVRRTSVGMDSFVNEYYQISIDKLIPYQNQARVLFDDEEILRLSQTIQEHGIRQPLTVMKSSLDDGKFEVVSGERRLRAAKLLGLEKVPCIILQTSEQAEEIALVENIQRSDLHPLELARALKSLSDTRGWGAQSEMKKKLGLPQSTISELLKLTTLDQDIQDLLLKKNFRGRDNLRELFKMASTEEQKNFVENRVAKKEKRITTQPLLRIYRDDKGLRLQKTYFASLEEDEKNVLKEMLQEVLVSLEK